MYVKKTGGKIFGAGLSKSEQKALDMEIRRQLAEYDKKNTAEVDAMVLYVLMTQFGFGETRLRRFHDAFMAATNELLEHYEMEDCDLPWLCIQKLKDHGIDISTWSNTPMLEQAKIKKE